MCTTFRLFHPSVGGHLRCFHLLAITSNIAIGVHVPESLLSVLWEYIPKNVIAGSYGNIF